MLFSSKHILPKQCAADYGLGFWVVHGNAESYEWSICG